MSRAQGEARILIATDDGFQAEQMSESLRSDFPAIRISLNSALVAHDFDDFKPDILVLAFTLMEKAERYHQMLLRLSELARARDYRTILLCDKTDVKKAFEACKAGSYDDYVLYWPQVHDGRRLAMSIWIAARNLPDDPPEAEPAAVAAAGIAIATQPRAPAPPAPRPATIEMHDEPRPIHIVSSRRPAGAEIARGTVAGGRVGSSAVGAHAGAAAQRERRLVVMAVDDDEFTRLLIKKLLHPDSFDLKLVTGGSEAFDLLRRIRPDVILMDVRLPGADGVDLVGRLKAMPEFATIPVVMMAGDSRRETVLSSIKAGASNFVVKPFTREELTAKLREVASGAGAGPVSPA
jgi:PleD family two-component response regulator